MKRSVYAAWDSRKGVPSASEEYKFAYRFYHFSSVKVINIFAERFGATRLFTA